MALTPEDVRNKRFTAVRFKEGYDLDEVDAFLDEIELTLSQLTKENADLRATSRGDVPSGVKDSLEGLESENSRLKRHTTELESQIVALQEAMVGAAGRGADVLLVPGDDNGAFEQLNATIAALRGELATVVDEKSHLASQLEDLRSSVEAQGPLSLLHNESVADVTTASVRILELAQRTADEHLATARIEAEQLRIKTQNETDNMVNEAKTTVANLTREFESQRVTLERKIEELRAYEREYRSRLRSYLEGQLRELENKTSSADRELMSEPGSGYSS